MVSEVDEKTETYEEGDPVDDEEPDQEMVTRYEKVDEDKDAEMEAEDQIQPDQDDQLDNEPE